MGRHLFIRADGINEPESRQDSDAGVGRPTVVNQAGHGLFGKRFHDIGVEFVSGLQSDVVQ
jgi:hypothetical protein